jgi:hypothetical protein
MARTRSSIDGANDASIESASNSAEMIIVEAGTKAEAVLQWDAEGHGLLFDGKQNFIQLPADVVAALSSINKTRYRHAVEYHKVWVKTADDGVFNIKVDAQLTSKPKDKLHFKVPKGMTGYWERPENVRSSIANGWAVADDKTESFLGLTGGAHRVGRVGQEELVLMVKDKKKNDAEHFAKAAENSRKAGVRNPVVTPEARQAGIMEYDESKDRSKRSWNELVSTDSVGEE